MEATELVYKLIIHIPEDPDGVIVKLSRDGRAVDRNTDALIPALDYIFDSLKRDIHFELTGVKD